MAEKYGQITIMTREKVALHFLSVCHLAKPRKTYYDK
jgi:hypothetical protein